MRLEATEVFEWNWDAIHAGYLLDESGRPILDEDDNPQRKIRYIINEGSSRSSKTMSLIDCFDLYARENKNKRLTVWRDTKSDCRLTVLNDTERHLQMTGRYEKKQKFNKTESKFTYFHKKDGEQLNSTWEIMGTDELNKVMGLGQDAAWFNEPYKISKAVFDAIDQRTRDFIIIDWNPKESHWIDDLKKNPRAIVLNSTFRNNPFCPPEQRAKILSYQPVSRSFVVESGLMTTEDAKVYSCSDNELNIDNKHLIELARCQQNEFQKSADDFNWSVYGMGEKAEKPNRIFRFIEIPDEQYQNLSVKEYHGVDWGAVDPFGVLGVKYYDGALYLHEKNYTCENVIRANLTQTEYAQVQGSDEGLVVWLFKRMGIPLDSELICDNNRSEKILALRSVGYDYAVAAIKGPGSIKDGTDLLNAIPVYFTASSKNLKYEQENHSRKVDPYGNVTEEPEDKDNHLLDPARYVAQYLRREGIINVV